jgi:carbamoyl-phosphate synthase large subunit
MKSTGEVMGVGDSFGEAFVKSQLAAGVRLPRGGRAFISVRDADKPGVLEIARGLHALGFALVATRGTAAAIAAAGIPVATVNKVAEGRPHVVDMIKNGEIDLIVNTVDEKRTRSPTRARSGRPRCRVASPTTRRSPAPGRPAPASAPCSR